MSILRESKVCVRVLPGLCGRHFELIALIRFDRFSTGFEIFHMISQISDRKWTKCLF